MSDTNDPKPITAQLEEIKDEICTHYCKWLDLWDEEKEGMDLSESEHCRNCVLDRL